MYEMKNEVSLHSPSLVFPTTPFTLVVKQPFLLTRDESWNKSSCTFSIKEKNNKKTDFQVQVLLMRIKTKTYCLTDCLTLVIRPFPCLPLFVCLRRDALLAYFLAQILLCRNPGASPLFLFMTSMKSR